MQSASFLIKPASSSCNLRCSYCFYFDVSNHREQDNYGIMDEETMNAMIDKIFADMDENGKVTFGFQGGEPTVAGLDYFKRFTQRVDAVKGTCIVNYALQTNGTLINDEWCEFFHEYKFLLGVSLDGYETNMNKFRYDAQKKGVYYRVLNGIKLLRKHNVDFNILCVITKSLAEHPKALFNYFKENKFDYVQLIPCLPSLNNDEEMNREALTPELYASFFGQFYDCWLKHLRGGHYMSVNLFDNLIGMINGNAPYQCGMLGYCSPQSVVEADGSVYPCDFFVTEDLKLGNFNEMGLVDLIKSEPSQAFLKVRAEEKEICKSCKFRNMCHGGCKRQNVCFLKDDYCGYQHFLGYVTQTLPQIAKMF